MYTILHCSVCGSIIFDVFIEHDEERFCCHQHKHLWQQRRHIIPVEIQESIPVNLIIVPLYSAELAFTG